MEERPYVHSTWESSMFNFIFFFSEAGSQISYVYTSKITAGYYYFWILCVHVASKYRYPVENYTGHYLIIFIQGPGSSRVGKK